MSTTSILLIGTHGQSLAQAATPLGSLAELSGFLLVLLTAALIIAAMERVKGRR
ncbi:MAG TPA: hypothetical protein VLX85_17535 [Stellaceae bacterium]|nr:hypothetical protein [Stellaceae bacterium]